MSEIQVVVFNVNNQLCGVDTAQVQEIIRYQEVSKVPDMPDFIEGIINLRGRVVPVINLNKRFELGDTQIDRKTKIIITSRNGSLTGFIVNDVSEILRFGEEDMESTPGAVLNNTNRYLKGIGKKGDKLVSLLDLGKVLSDGEVTKLTNDMK